MFTVFRKYIVYIACQFFQSIQPDSTDSKIIFIHLDDYLISYRCIWTFWQRLSPLYIDPKLFSWKQVFYNILFWESVVLHFYSETSIWMLSCRFISRLIDWLHVLSYQCKISIRILFWLLTGNHSMFSITVPTLLELVIVKIFCGKLT